MALTAQAWDHLIQQHPQAHILQTAAWGELKSDFGWSAERVSAGAAAALVLFRHLPLGLTLAYVPRGPLADWGQPAELTALRGALDAACRARRAIALKCEPDLDDTANCRERLAALGFRPSPHAVQPRRTLVVDLAGAESDVLARMKQKTRYNINLAGKKGVTAGPGRGPADLERFVELLRVTGARDQFAVHAPAYYRRAYELFHPAGQCELILAEYEGQALAGVMVFALGSRAWYFYGASSDRERNRMAPYLAQWEAMRWAKARGALSYDLWGVPDEDEPSLEAQFEQRHDGLWGVYRFKRGFGGRLLRTVGAWDRPYQPALYQLYLLYARLRSGGRPVEQ